MSGSKKIIWEAVDHIKVEKSNDWYWIVGIVGIGATVLAIYFNNILFALLILIGIFSIFIQSHAEPKIERFEINRKGVAIGETLYPFSTLESFWVIDEDGWDRDRILIKSKKIFMQLIVLPLGPDIQPDEIRDYLLEYLDEEHMEEGFFDKLSILMGF
jgi:hypothetical protein